MTRYRDLNLPDDPSELIRLAAKDLDAVVDLPKFKFNIMQYLSFGRPDECQACVAGSVIIEKLGMDCFRGCIVSPSQFPKDTFRKLEAISCLSFGLIDDALKELGMARRLLSRIPGWRHPPSISMDHFIQNLHDLAGLLEDYGL